MLTMDKVNDARRVLEGVVRHTDIQKAHRFTNDCLLFFKPENLQKTGSFKVRGAAYKIAKLSEKEREKGVIACSAGNHAQGVALAAMKNNIKSIICLPAGAPISKIEATKSYGAEVCLVPGVYDDAYKKALELRDEFGYTFVHPFDDEDVIAGQATIAMEALDELPDIEAVIVPIGGGGLISGVAYAVKNVNPKIKVYGVQAESAPSMLNSVRDGKIETLSSVNTIADGIAVKTPGENTFRLVNEYVDDIVTISEKEICSAILALVERQKMIAEGAGAVSVAAAMFGKLPIQGKKVLSIISGGNIDVTNLSSVLKRGLMNAGRITSLTIELMDKPGQLERVVDIISKSGANIKEIRHNRAANTDNIYSCYLNVEMETRDYEHGKEIVANLEKLNIKVIHNND
ncbi:MAG: threonine ammonia-lyase [Clostridiales bacterium]|nr:threonine ammonia-lyase [Clostridiales bacterium]